MKKSCHIVNHKPSSCPFCKGRIVTIIYGSVPPEIVQEAIEGKLILGGRFISSNESPEWACINCGTRFLKERVEVSEFIRMQLVRSLYRSVFGVIGVVASKCYEIVEDFRNK
ncbi:TPA: hypothetical protein ACGZ92_002661 [Elizabethkingia anophelis]